jgi:chromosome segregation ATPase
MSYSVSSPTGAGAPKTNGSTTPGLGDDMTPDEEIESLKAQLSDERARRSRLNESMLLIRQKVSGEVQRLELQSTQLNATVDKLTSDVADRDATIALLKEENEVNNALLKRGEERLAEVTREMEHAIFQRDCSTGDIDELNSQVAELQGQVEDLQQQDKTKEKTISKLKAELTEQTNLVGSLKSQLAAAHKVRLRCNTLLTPYPRLYTPYFLQTIEELRSSPHLSSPPDALVKLRSSYEGALSEMSGVMTSVRREQDVLRDEREGLRRELENVKKDSDNLRRENKSLNDEKRIEGARYQALLTEANDRLAEQRRGLRREEQTLQSQLSLVRTEAETYKSQVATLRGELESTKSQFTSVRGENETLRMQLMSAKSEVESTKSQLSGTRSELESLRIQLATARAEVEAYRVQLEPSRVREAEWKRDAEVSKAGLSALESEILALKDDAAREIGTLREKLKAFEAAASSPRDIVELKAALASREMALSNVRRELEGSQKAHAQVVEKHGDPSAEISLARLVAHLREENERLKGELEAIKRQLEDARAAHKSAVRTLSPLLHAFISLPLYVEWCRRMTLVKLPSMAVLYFRLTVIYSCN